MCTWQCHHRRCCLQCSGVGLVLFRLCYTRWDSTCRLGARRTHRRSLCSYFALQHVQAAGRRRRPSDIMPWVPKEDRPTMSRDCSFLLPPPYLYTLQFRVYTTIESTMVRLLQYSGTAVHQVVLSFTSRGLDCPWLGQPLQTRGGHGSGRRLHSRASLILEGVLAREPGGWFGARASIHAEVLRHTGNNGGDSRGRGQGW